MELHPRLTVNRVASGAIAPYRIVAAATADKTVIQATPRAKLVGVSGQLATLTTERLDVHFGGVVPVEYGGTVAHGDPLTADAEGRAIVASPGDPIIGSAFEGGVEDEIGSVLLAGGGAAARFQQATGTLVSGVCVIDEGIVVTAATRAYPVAGGPLSGTTNLACLAHDVADNVAGAPATGSVRIEALTAAGIVDTDAAGPIQVLLVG